MSNEVYVPVGESTSDTAVLLLEAAEKQEQRPDVVRYVTTPPGFFTPKEIAKAAGVDYREDDSDEGFTEEVEEARAAEEKRAKQAEAEVETEAKKAPTKKAAAKAPAKKTAAKKTTAKKTAAKKTTSKES